MWTECNNTLQPPFTLTIFKPAVDQSQMGDVLVTEVDEPA